MTVIFSSTEMKSAGLYRIMSGARRKELRAFLRLCSLSFTRLLFAVALDRPQANSRIFRPAHIALLTHCVLQDISALYFSYITLWSKPWFSSILFEMTKKPWCKTWWFERRTVAEKYKDLKVTIN